VLHGAEEWLGEEENAVSESSFLLFFPAFSSFSVFSPLFHVSLLFFLHPQTQGTGARSALIFSSMVCRKVPAGNDCAAFCVLNCDQGVVKIGLLQRSL